MARLKTPKTTDVSATLKGAAFAAAAAILVPYSVDAGNGNGNGNGNQNANENRGNHGRGNQNNEVRNNRGEIASGLRNLNAANANENAFLNANPNSNVGQLQTYRTAVIDSSNLIHDQNEAAQTLIALQSLTPEQIEAQFPAGDYDAVLAQANVDYQAATQAAQTAEAEREAVLAQLTGGRDLTDAQLAALYDLLGF